MVAYSRVSRDMLSDIIYLSTLTQSTYLTNSLHDTLLQISVLIHQLYVSINSALIIHMYATY